MSPKFSPVRCGIEARLSDRALAWLNEVITVDWRFRFCRSAQYMGWHGRDTKFVRPEISISQSVCSKYRFLDSPAGIRELQSLVHETVTKSLQILSLGGVSEGLISLRVKLGRVLIIWLPHIPIAEDTPLCPCSLSS